MVAVPLVRVFWGQPFLQFFREAGAPVERYLREARLSPEVERRPEMAMPSRPLYCVLDRLTRELGRHDVGLQAGETFGILNLGSFGRNITNQETLGDAIVTARKLMPSVHTARQISLSTTGSMVRLSSRLDDAQLAPTLWDDQFALSLLIDLARLTAGSDWTPERVTIQARPTRKPRPVGLLAGTTIRYGADATSVELPRTLLSCRMELASGRGSDRAVPRYPDAYLGPLPTDYIGSLQVTMDTLMAQGYTDIKSLASLIGVSVRTLQRRLSEHGTRFSELLARSRFGHARQCFLDPAAKVTDVAREAGYSDPTHFTRAFRSWAGLPPVAYLAAHASANAPTARNKVT